MLAVNSKILRAERLLVPLSALAAILFVVLGVGRSIWLDEANSILIARQNFQELIERLRIENNLPAYYLLLRLWISQFGDSEAAARLLSGLFYIATVVVMFYAGRFHDRSTRTGLYSAFFYLISTQAIHQAQNIRMYSMLGFVSALSMLFLLRVTLRSAPRARDSLMLAVVNAVGSLTHMWFFFLIGAEVLAAIFFAERRRAMRVLVATAASALPFTFLWLPTLGDQLQNGATDWMLPFLWIEILDVPVRYYGGEEFRMVGSAVFYGACIVMLNRMGKAAFRQWSSSAHTRLLAACVFLSIASALVVSVFKPIYYPDRYTIIALPALGLFIADALARFSQRTQLVVVCYIFLAAQVVMKIHLRDKAELVPRGHSDRRTAEFIFANVPHGDVLAFTSLSRLSIDYYLERFGCRSCYRETSFPTEIDQHPSWRFVTTDAHVRDAHIAEAKRLVDTWRVAGTSSVWLVYGGDPDIGQLLKDEIEKHYMLQERIHLQGRYHLGILRYRSPAAQN